MSAVFNFIQKYFLVVVLVGVGGYYFYTTHKNPCDTPISYRIGTFDSGFGITQSEFLADAKEAAEIWEAPLGKQLFVYDANGSMPINLIYDQRQKTTQEDNALNATISTNSTVANSVKEQFVSLEAQFKNGKDAYDTELAAYNKNLEQYNAEITYYNSKGGAPPAQYEALNNQKAALSNERDQLQSKQTSLNALSDQVNAFIKKYNILVDQINANVDQVNSTAGSEFTEGEFTQQGSDTKIDIWEFNNKTELVRVLAHEMGHALGLDHNTNPDSIMYAVNQSTSEKLSPQDLAAIKARCKIT